MKNNDYQLLFDISNSYENHLINKYGSLSIFYKDAPYDNYFEKFKQELVSNLIFIGAGKCCEVYSTKENFYVLKIHIPYNEKLDLRSNPSKQIFEICKSKSEPDQDTNYAHPKAVLHFLCLEYITPNGLAGIQQKADCTAEARQKAYKLFGNIDPYLQKCNHINNMGMLDDKPVYIDWF